MVVAGIEDLLVQVGFSEGRPLEERGLRIQGGLRVQLFWFYERLYWERGGG
jgi:hypothetical protein